MFKNLDHNLSLNAQNDNILSIKLSYGTIIYSCITESRSVSSYLVRGLFESSCTVWIRVACFTFRRPDGCGMTDLWDVVEPERRNGEELCPTLFLSKSPTPFRRAFYNAEYVVLKV
jgi:hypothetical protein